MKYVINSVRKVVANNREMFVFELSNFNLPLFVSVDYISRKLRAISMPESLLLSSPQSFEIDGEIELRKAGSKYEVNGEERERKSDSLNLKSGAQLTLSQQGQMFSFLASQMAASFGTTAPVAQTSSNTSDNQVETPETEVIIEEAEKNEQPF